VPRGNPIGRPAGTVFGKRDLKPVHFKGSIQQNDSKKSISNTTENGQEQPNTNEIALILSRLKLDLKKLGLSQSEFVELLISSV
jgi:hypothetical protein